MTQPLISVIVPVYNVEKYLDRCVESIVNQTYKNLEIILVDDGSPDNCPQMCDDWAAKDSRIKVIHKENGGVSSARNAGLDIAEGEYIGFVDGDDIIENTFYETLLNLIKDHDLSIAACPYYKDNGEETETYSSENVTDNLISEYLSDKLFQPSVHNKLISKDLIGYYRFDISKRIGEDYLFNFYILQNCKFVSKTDKKLYCYCQNDESATHTLNIEMASRWNNTKQILNSGLLSKEEIAICKAKYASELVCICREILKGSDKTLLIEYKNICNEIKTYKTDFLKLNLSEINKLSIKLICISPKLFKAFYLIYTRRI